MTNPNPLSAALRHLRAEAGLSGSEAARRAGLSQSKVSRAETGTFMPTEDDIRALCTVYGVSAAARRDLVQMVRDLREGTTAARVVLQRGGWWMQQRIGKLEAAASTIRTFAPAVMVGLLQTKDYVRALFGDWLPDDDRDRTIDARLERQRILDTGRQFTFVMAEGALRWNMGSPAIMVNQLDHLAEMTHRPNVAVGIIPWTTPGRVPAVHAYTIYDSRAVLVGTHTATAIITDQRDVTDYQAHWAEVEPLASYGDQARAVIQRVRDDYSSLL